MAAVPFVSFDPVADSVTVGPNLNLANSNANSGTFVSTWNSIGGVSSPPSVVNIQWMRLGNAVHCNFATSALTTPASGLLLATITLPFPMIVPPSGGPRDPMGVAVFLGGAGPAPSQSGIIAGAGANPNVAGINSFNVPAMANTLLAGTFSYRIA